MNYLSIRLYVIHNHQLCCGLISCFLDFFQSFFSVYFSAGLVSDAVLQFTSLLGQLLFFFSTSTILRFYVPIGVFFLCNAIILQQVKVKIIFSLQCDGLAKKIFSHQH